MERCAAQQARVEDQAKEKQNVVITIVYDNYPMDERLETAWGFACVIEGLDETILFDTGGNGELLLSNMKRVGIKPEQIDSVVLSHFHRDHTGGLDAFLKVNNEVKVFVPRLFPSSFRQHVNELGAKVVETEGPQKICDGAWTTGVLKEPLAEQGICLESSEGLFVVTGCAHPGIARMAVGAKIRAKTPVHTVLGGFHMSRASDDRIKMVTRRLKEIGVQRAAPSHCSGDKTRQLMKEAFGEQYLPSGLGARLAFRKR